MRLLIVEDDKPTIQSYQDNIESFNKTSNTKIIAVIKENINSAKEALISPDYDAAIVDLKLSSNTTELKGLEIVEEINDKLRFPLFIVSGSIGQIHYEENAFFKKRSRDGDFKAVLNELMSIYNTGITKILGKSGQINDYLNIIFWKHLSNSLDLWINDEKRDSEEKQKSLLRYTLLHIQEYLELSKDSDFEDYHPAEVYIIPTIKERLFTGDIVIENGTNQKYIVLTPSCDMAQRKAKDFLLVNIENIDTGLINEKLNLIKKGNAKQEELDEAKETIRALISNSYSNKYHFLPKYKEIKAGLINFQKLRSIRQKEFEISFKILASTNSSFTKDIIARFSYYYSRQGSPDFNIDEVYESLF
ncbi:MAG: hypothetical protein AB7S69_17335 [Salinivirgaceae bacterium]